MNTSVILQVVTVAFSVVTILFTYFMDSIFNRKARKVNVLSYERLNTLKEYRNAYGKIFALCDPNTILEYGPDIDIQKGNYYRPFLYDLHSAENKIEVYLIPFFAQEKHLIKTSQNLVQLATQYYYSDHKNIAVDDKLKELLITKREEFFRECSIYDWALMEYIIHQADGKTYHVTSFDKFYDTIIEQTSGSSNSELQQKKDNAFNTILNQFYNSSTPKKGEKK